MSYLRRAAKTLVIIYYLALSGRRDFVLENFTSKIGAYSIFCVCDFSARFYLDGFTAVVCTFVTDVFIGAAEK